jgi:hypothetical protein
MRVEAELAIKRALTTLLSNYLDLFTRYSQDSKFRESLTSLVLDVIDEKESVGQNTPSEPLK